MPFGPVHGGYTPAAEELINMGPCVLPYMFKIISSDERDPLTRSAAVVVVSEIARDFCNDDPKIDFTTEESNRWNALWRDMGYLGAEDSLDQRKSSVERWKVWLAAREVTLRK